MNLWKAKNCKLTVPPTNIFLVSELPLPEFRGTAALASTFLPSMTCCRVYTANKALATCASSVNELTLTIEDLPREMTVHVLDQQR